MRIQTLIDWFNENEGLLSVILFLMSLLFGWITGIFRSLVRKPRFRIRIIPKMTFGTIYLTGEKYTPPTLGTYKVHKTAFVIYLEITNVGSAASNLGKIEIGYYKDDGKSTFFQRRLWIRETNILADFVIPTGDGQAVRIPHLRQSSLEFNQHYDGFLQVGQSILGAAYFEQYASWGNNYPRVDERNFTKLKISVKDAFGDNYSKIFEVPIKTIQDAFRYNPRFGLTEHYFDKDMIEDKGEEESKETEGGGK